MAEKRVILKTKHLRLTPMTDEELAALQAAEPDAELAAAYGEMLSLSRANPADRLWYTAWKVSKKEAPEALIGTLGFKGPQRNGRVELGYGIELPHRNQGYCTEAARTLIEWAFAQKDVYMIEAETAPDNEASLKVLKKLEFKENGQGLEGPRFRRSKPATSWLAVYMCLGMSIGVSFGNVMHSMGVGSCLGMAIGLCIGAGLDASERKHRALVTGEAAKEDDEE